MGRLESPSKSPKTRLTTSTENTPTQRLVAAIAYKNDIMRTELAGWHDTGRRTIHSRLDRLVETA
jgi:hypothetical protein